MKKPVVFISFILCVIILLSIFQIAVSNKLSTTGGMLSKLDNQIETLGKENLLLKEDLLTQSSLANISAVADKEGFTEEKSHMFLEAPLPLARQ